MRALRLFGAGDIRLVEIPEPQITEEEILLKTDAAAVCGTDIRMWKNGHKGVDAEHPLTLGHEFSGTIVETGTKVPFYKKGMKVAMHLISAAESVTGACREPFIFARAIRPSESIWTVHLQNMSGYLPRQ